MINDQQINAAVLALNTYRLKVEGIKTEEQQREAMAAVLEAVGFPGLVKALETIERTTFSGDEMGDEYQRGNRDAHETCAKMAHAALASAKERTCSE